MEQNFRDRADKVHHLVGTCRVGIDGMAAMDPRLNVRRLEGLRVADGAIMPILVSGDANARSITIGETCADMIKVEYDSATAQAE